MDLIKNRKLRSHAYGGWFVKDALHNAVNNKDVRLIVEKKHLFGTPLLSDPIEIFYLICDDNHRSYKVKLTTDEKDYYLFLKNNEKEKK